MIVNVVFGVIIALVIAGLFAPTGALSWWRRVESDAGFCWPTLDEAHARPGDLPDAQRNIPGERARYVVYLSGIGISGPDELPVSEGPTVAMLDAMLDDTEIIYDIYPYSVENTALTQGRTASGLWRTLTRWKRERHPLRWLSFLINLRNGFQVFVSLDQRYGPVLHRAIAQQIAAALLRHGYVPEHRRPVILLGWSGGAQIAAGACWWLAELGIPVSVVSMAGIIAADPGIDRASHLWHLYGSKDLPQKIGAVVFASRWPVRTSSSWNRAKAEGRLEERMIGPLSHTGSTGYYSASELPGIGVPRELTCRAIVDVLREDPTVMS